MSDTIRRVDGDGIVVVGRVGEERCDQLLGFYAEAWWTTTRRRDDVQRMLDGTPVVVGLVERTTDRLVGFARAITDGAYLAVILDVIVTSDRRGRGLGALLMNAILARPELAGVDSIELVCQPDIVGFYARWGFTDRVGGSRLMRRTANPLLGGAVSNPGRQSDM